VSLIAGHGLLAFRDPLRHPPAVHGPQCGDGTVMVASESVALEGTGHVFERNIARRSGLHRPGRQGPFDAVRRGATLNPCIFEFVYLARPDSVIDGISVYQARLNLGETLAKRVISTVPPNEIDVVIPIPESSRPSAMQLAHCSVCRTAKAS
jgi:amidophosphoribosyltransferase